MALTVLSLWFVTIMLTERAAADDEFGVYGSRLEGAAHDKDLLLTSIDWFRSNMPGMTLIWSIEGTAQPKLRGRLPGAYSTQEMAVMKPFAFLLNDRRLMVYNLSQPGKPYQVHQRELETEAVALRVVNDRLWVHGAHEVHIYRFAPAAGLVEVGHILSDERISALHVDRSKVYLDLNGERLAQVMGTEASGYDLKTVYVMEAERRVVAVDDSRVYLEADGKLSIVDITGKISSLVGQLDIGNAFVSRVQDQKAFLIERKLKVMDLRNPGSSITVSDADIDLGFERVSDVFPFGRHVLIGTHHSGLRFYSLDDLPHPKPKLYWNSLDYTADLVVQNGVVFAANGHAGVAIFEAGNDGSLRFVSSIDTPGFVVDVALHGNLLFIADEFAGVSVANVSNPREPGVLAHYPIADGAMDLAVQGRRLFVSSRTGRLTVFDVSPEGQLKTNMYWELGIQRVGMTAAGKIYGGGAGGEVYHLDFGMVGSRPELTSYSFPFLGRPMSLEAFGDELYVAAWKDGFAYFAADGRWHDLPWEAFADFRNTYHIRDLALHRNWLYMATGARELLMAKPLALLQPHQEAAGVDWFAGYVRLNRRSYGLAQEGNRLYVLTSDHLMMLDVSEPLRPIIKAEAPLPLYQGPAR
jgi:hypothetical protein